MTSRIKMLEDMLRNKWSSQDRPPAVSTRPPAQFNGDEQISRTVSWIETDGFENIPTSSDVGLLKSLPLQILFYC